MGFQHVVPWLGSNRDILAIQHGTVNITNGNSTVNDTIASVLTNKAFLLFSYTTTENTPTPDDQLVRGRIVNSTTLTFDIGDTISDQVEIAWTVIEFKPSAPVNVQHLSGTVTGTTMNIAISAVDLAHSFPLYTWTTQDTAFDSDNYSSVELTSTTNIQLNSSGVNGNTYGVQVISNERWNVSEYIDTIAAGNTNENTPISAIDTSSTMIFATGADTGTGAVMDGSQFLIYYVTSSTNLQANRRVNGHVLRLVYYVVETFGRVLTSLDGTELIQPGDSTGVWNHIAVNPANTAYHNKGFLGAGYGRNNTNTTSRGEDIAGKIENTSATSATRTRGFNSGTVQLRQSFGLMDFTNA